MENKLDKLKKILEVSSRDTISAKEIEKFLVLVLTTIKKERESFKDFSDEQKDRIEKGIYAIEDAKNELSRTIDNKIKSTASSFTKELEAVRKLIENIELTPEEKGESIKGEDGYTPIKGIDYNDGSPDTGEDIVDKVNKLPTNKEELKIDASHIKNLPKIEKGKFIYGNSSGVKEIIAGTNITVDNTNLGYPVINSTGGGGGIDGSGTTNELTYWVDTDTLGSLTTVTYPSLTELSYVKGVTSAIQTQLDGKIDGTMVSNRIPYGSDANTLQTSANLTWDNTNNYVHTHFLNVGSGSDSWLPYYGDGKFYFRAQAIFDGGLTSSVSVKFGGAGAPGGSVNLSAVSTGTTVFPFVVMGFASQTANLTEWRDSADAVLASVSAAGVVGASGLTLGTGSITMTGSLAATGARVTKGWFTDIESTNMPTVGGTAILTSLTAPQFTTIELGHATDTTLSRVSAGVVAIEGITIDTISAANTLTNKTLTTPLLTVLVEPNTAGVGSPNIITTAESYTTYTNEGTTALNYHTLPTATAGLTYTFYVDDVDGIRITANTGDIIQINGVVSASAGYAECTAIGGSVTLTAINTTDWVATSVIGTWTLV